MGESENIFVILGKHPVDDSDDDFLRISMMMAMVCFCRDHYDEERGAPGEAVDKMDTVGHRNTGIE